jgi:hypothetical protein
MTEIIAPILAALATAIGGTLVAWFSARMRPGRFERTVEQVNKLADYVTRSSAAIEALAKMSGPNKEGLEKLMGDSVEAIRQDFAAERTALPEFEKNASTVRRAMLLYMPHRWSGWLSFLIFHTMLLFVIYFLILRFARGNWQPMDVVPLLIAVGCAALARLAAELTLKPVQ